MSTLVLAQPQPSWWDQFRRGRAEPDPSAAPLWARWSRSLELGAPDEQVSPEQGLVRGGALREHQERLAPLVRQTGALFNEAAGAAAARDFTLLLANDAGVVVTTGGGGAFGPLARRVRLIEGACWTEAARGTNAIGTALVEGRPTVVTGGAHYARPFRDLVCYAAPIRDLDGNVVAVLDATSAVGAANEAVGALVVAAALAMEASLKAAAWARAGAQAASLVERTLDRVPEPALLVEAPGRILRYNRAARLALGSKGAGLDVATAFGVSWAALRAAALGPGGATLALPRFGELGAVSARLEPLVAADGALLAVAVFVEAGARPGREPRRERGSVSRDERGMVAAADPFAAVFTEDPTTNAAISLGRRVAKSDVPIVLLAETGSGKERFAEAIHGASLRREGPFVAVNCGSFAPELLAAELFGYGPGAFTGADRAGREGLLHAAAGGTLFLDEIGEMPASMQVALLRVLEDGRYERVGERAPRRADVRVLCATCRDLPALVASGAFRQDLWFRLKGVVLRLPPLRARTDRLALAGFLVRGLAAPSRAPDFDSGFESFLLDHPWPGNVRELKSVLEVALVLADGAPVLTREHLPPDLDGAPSRPAPPAPQRLDQVEASAVRDALSAARGNVSAAAKQLGVARSTIYRILGRPSR